MTAVKRRRALAEGGVWAGGRREKLRWDLGWVTDGLVVKLLGEETTHIIYT